MSVTLSVAQQPLQVSWKLINKTS